MSSHPVTTFLATYEKEFWREKNLSGDVYVFDRLHRRGPIDFCWNISKWGTPVLYGRIFSCAETSHNKENVFRERVLEELCEYFGEEALHPTDYYEQTWHRNSSQMFCGMAGAIIDDIFDEKHIGDRIYWAGAETSAEWNGQLAGAVCSGIRAALEVLYDLRPSVLTSDDLIFLRPTQRSLKKPPREYNSPIHSILGYVANWKTPTQRSLKKPPREYNSTIYSILGYVANWKTYLPLSLLIVLVLWRLKILIVN